MELQGGHVSLLQGCWAKFFFLFVFWFFFLEARQTYKSISFKMLSFGSSMANVIKHSVTNL